MIIYLFIIKLFKKNKIIKNIYSIHIKFYNLFLFHNNQFF